MMERHDEAQPPDTEERTARHGLLPARPPRLRPSSAAHPRPPQRPAPRREKPVVVIGGGFAGLAAALDLAAAGRPVILLERAAAPGGKARQLAAPPAGHGVDAGPTVLTMRWAFDGLFEAAGTRLEDHLTLSPLQVLARHAWADHPEAAPFDLHADPQRAVEAVGRFAGVAEARRYQAFCDRARRIYQALEEPFIRAERAGPLALIRRLGARKTLELTRIAPVTPLWGALGRVFKDDRLRRLFARYATYCGSSPFQAPAVLMLVAHVEREGVWRVEGGMTRLAHALAEAAEASGADIRYGAEAAEILIEQGRAAGVRLANGDRIEAAAVIAAGDAAALGAGRFGAAAAKAVTPPPRAKRSLSAVVWAGWAQAEGFPLAHHNVFFPEDYRAEFDDVFQRRRTPQRPTVYVCAQDRSDGGAAPAGVERLQLLVNAPADGDLAAATAPGGPLSESEIDQCETRMTALLARCGLSLTAAASGTTRWERTGPMQFNQLFPGTGGALYGPANHGPLGTFQRPGGRTAIPGLHLAGGSAHPGPGAPMSALSGRLAAARVMAEQG